MRSFFFILIFLLFVGCASTGGYYSYKFPEPPSYPYSSTIFVIERYPFPFWLDDWGFYGGIYLYFPSYPRKYIPRRTR